MNVTDTLRRAPLSYSTLKMECIVVGDSRLLAKASRPRQSTALLEAGRPLEGVLPPPKGTVLPSQTRTIWLVWWHRPECWRDELVWPDGRRAVNMISPAVTAAYLVDASGTLVPPPQIVSGVRSPYWSRPSLADRLREVPLLSPAVLADTWRVVQGEQVEFIGRRSVRARAHRETTSGAFLWDFIDTLDLVVDEERGVVLRCAAITDGLEAAVIEVRSILFDEPLPPEVFSMSFNSTRRS